MSDRFDTIREAIHLGKPVSTRLYVVSDENESEIQFILSQILKKYSQSKHIHSLYTITKEITLNATKANIKRAVFQELNLNLKNPVDYKKGLLSLKEKLREKYLVENSKKLKDLKLYVDVKFEHDEHSVQIEVINGVPLSKGEDARIRAKFKIASNYDDIANFYLEEMDNVEGAGIGIVMILMLLKEKGIDQRNFIIESDNKKYTRAYLNFPF